jgi:coiled-coil domain-containing protein 12
MMKAFSLNTFYFLFLPTHTHIHTMEEEARKRRERLRAVREAKELGVPEGQPRPTLRFRNYTPLNQDIASEVETPEVNLKRRTTDTVERAVAGLTDQVLATEEERQKAEMDLFTLAPRKANWDLKRDVEKKLAKLERQTQACIIELIRQRLQGEQGQQVDLADAVSAQHRSQTLDKTRVEADEEDEDEEA